MNYGLGVSLFLGSIILLIKVNGMVSIFWDWQTFLFVIFGSLALLVANKSLGDIRSFGVEVRQDLVRSLERVGATGAIIGFIQMLQNFSDPKSIGPAMAVCLLSVFYAQGFVSIVNFQNLKPQTYNSLSLTIGVLTGAFFIIILALT